MHITRLTADQHECAIDELAEVLRACVDGGASVNFLRPLAFEDAQTFWVRALREPDAVTLVSREGGRIVGTVRLLPATQPNGPHRAEVSKLLVHPESRGRGVARALMRALEDEARARGRTTLVLDTETGCAAERLYLRWGWQVVGMIPDFALNTDGVLGATTIMTKRLAAPDEVAAPGYR